MEALFIFIAKSSGLLVLFYFAYFFLLRKETFFNSNRWFLIAGLLTSVILPLVVYTEIVWIDPTPVAPVNYPSNYVTLATQLTMLKLKRHLKSTGIGFHWPFMLLVLRVF